MKNLAAAYGASGDRVIVFGERATQFEWEVSCVRL